MKFRRVATAIISLIYTGFLLLCCYSGPVEKGPIYAPVKGPLKVTLSGGTFPADAEELKFPIQPQDFDLLGYFTELKTADFRGSSCTDDIAAWAGKNPDVSVTFDVKFPKGIISDNNAESLDLSGITRADVDAVVAALKYTPDLTAIELGSSTAENSLSGEDLAAIQAAAPKASLSYSIELLGKPVSLDVTTLDLSGLSHEDAASVYATLCCMPNLESIDLGDENSNDLSFEDIALLQSACPEAHYEYSYTLWEQKISINDESMNFSHIPMDDQGAAVRAAMPVMKNCTFVDMDFCGVSNENMAKLREDFPDTKFVWRIWFGTGYSVRTDVEKILASKPSKGGAITNENIQVLQYCTDLKYLDIGHNSCVTDLSFAYGTPNLEVLVMMSELNVDQLKNAPHVDLTPLASCPHLEYIELNSTSVSDLSPLAGLTELRHLNIGCCPNVSDISPLYSLKDLERLWIGNVDPVPADQVKTMQDNAPDCVIDTTTADPTQGGWRFADLNDEGWKTWAEYHYFTFENHPRYDLLRKQFGYDDGLAAYSFSENDPLY